MQKDLKIKISIDKKTGELKVVGSELDELNRKTKQSAKSFDSASSSIAKFAAGAVSIYAVNEAFSAVVKTGLSFNSQMENAIAGLAALNVATSSNISAMGKHLTIVEKYNLAQKEAVETAKELAAINAETPHTLDETNQIYKAMYVSMKNAGASSADMVKITKEISIASGAAGIEFQSLLAGVDGLANGQVEANSEMGRFLSGLGLTNEALKNSSDVVGLINEKLKDFKAVDTMSVAVSNLKNEWEQLSGELTKPLFDDAKESIKNLTSFLKDNRGEIVDFGKDIVASATIVSNGLESIYLTSKIGYVRLIQLFKSEIQAGINSVIEMLESSLNYMQDSINEASDYWGKVFGTKFGEVDTIKLGRVKINDEALEQSISNATSKIAKLSTSTNKAFKEIATGYKKTSTAINETSKSISDHLVKKAKVVENAKEDNKEWIKALKEFYAFDPDFDDKKVKATFKDWGDTLNSSISNSLVDAIQSGDVSSAVDGLGASIASSMIQASSANIVNSAMGKNVEGYGGLMSISGLGGMAAGVAISGVVDYMFQEPITIWKRQTDYLSDMVKYNKEMASNFKFLADIGNTEFDKSQSVFSEYKTSTNINNRYPFLSGDKIIGAEDGLQSVALDYSTKLQEFAKDEAESIVADMVNTNEYLGKEYNVLISKTVEKKKKKGILNSSLGASSWTETIEHYKAMTDAEMQITAILSEFGTVTQEMIDDKSLDYTAEDFGTLTDDGLTAFKSAWSAMQSTMEELSDIQDVALGESENTVELNRIKENKADLISAIESSTQMDLSDVSLTNIADNFNMDTLAEASDTVGFSLKTVSTQFSELATILQSEDDIFQKTYDERDRLQGTLKKLKLQNDSEALLAYNRSLELKTIDDSNKAIQKAIYAQEDYIKAQEDYVKAQEEAAQALQDKYDWEVNIAELQASTQNKIADATYKAMKAAKDYSDSLKDLASSSTSLKDDLTTKNMSAKDKEFYYLSKMNNSKNTLETLLSAGGDIDKIKNSYDNLLTYSKSASDVTGANYQDSILNVIDKANTSLFDASKTIGVQIVSSAVDMAGLTQSQLKELGLAEDTSIGNTNSILSVIDKANTSQFNESKTNGIKIASSAVDMVGLTQSQLKELGLAEDTSIGNTNSTLETKLSDLISLQTAQLQADTTPFTATNSYVANHVLGKTEEAQFAQVAGKDYKNIYSMLYSLSNAGTQKEDFQRLMSYVGMDSKDYNITDTDKYNTLLNLENAGMLTKDTSALVDNLKKTSDRYDYNYNLNHEADVINSQIDDLISQLQPKMILVGGFGSPYHLQQNFTNEDIDALLSSHTYKDIDKLISVGANSSVLLALKNFLDKSDENASIGRYGSITGFSSGGYTGDIGADKIAGAVHGQEYVVNAKTTADLGLNNNNGGVFKDMLAEIKTLNKKVDNQNTLIIQQANELRNLRKTTQDIRDAS